MESDVDATQDDQQQREGDQCHCRNPENHANDEDGLFHDVLLG
jgi:hypothetical protein